MKPPMIFKKTQEMQDESKALNLATNALPKLLNVTEGAARKATEVTVKSNPQTLGKNKIENTLKELSRGNKNAFLG